MFLLRSRASLLLSLWLGVPVAAQFTCTRNGSDETTCLATMGDDNQHCAWCTLSGFSFCLSEQAAEAMEQTLHAQCDHYGGSDDDSNTDDAAKSDDNVTPTDDSVPDNFWTCLQQKDQSSCDGLGCSWCTAETAGFSLCMAGPAAEQAALSKFFSCDKTEEEEKEAMSKIADPYDTSCVVAFLNDQTEEGCTSAVDQDEHACLWCSMAGMTNLCLTAEQADMGSSLGITCEPEEARIVAQIQVEAPITDTSCMVAFIRDHSPAGCTAAVDLGGAPCEFCPLPSGAMDLCLTGEQAAMLEQSGYACQDATQVAQKNVYDTSCLMTTFSGATDKDNCVTTVDEDGQACQYCNVGGMASVCLTSAQVDMASSYGVACADEKDAVQDDPYDTSCIMAFMQDQTEQGCVSATDEDGDACKYCTMQGALNLCLTESQADMAGGLGIDCGPSEVVAAAVEESNDFFDMSCVKSFVQDQTEEGCKQARDEDGAACKWCHTTQAGDICLTATQGDMAGQLGMWCDDSDKSENKAKDNVNLPADFWTCLQNYEETGCSAGCTWCDTSVGMGFCLSTPVADATKECTFFDCNFKEDKTEETDPYDPTCLAAGMGSDDAEDVCNSTVDSDGNTCVWCDAAGVFGLCMSAKQAATVGNYLQCDAAAAILTAVQ